MEGRKNSKGQVALEQNLYPLEQIRPRTKLRLTCISIPQLEKSGGFVHHVYSRGQENDNMLWLLTEQGKKKKYQCCGISPTGGHCISMMEVKKTHMQNTD